MTKQESLQTIKERRDASLAGLLARVPYIKFMGITFDRRGDELTAIMHFNNKLIGNPTIPAIHGGATASFLETAAIIELAWSRAWEKTENGNMDVATVSAQRLPKTIDMTVDYLRLGLARDCYARARINRSGRRYASVHVEAWQDNRARLYAQATGHFLMPQNDGG